MLGITRFQSAIRIRRKRVKHWFSAVSAIFKQLIEYLNQIKLVESQMMLRFDLFLTYYLYAENVETLQSLKAHMRSIIINRVTRNFGSH